MVVLYHHKTVTLIKGGISMNEEEMTVEEMPKDVEETLNNIYIEKEVLEMRKFPRMRTSNEVIAEIRKEDPKTSIREYTIEQLVAKGIIGHVDVGKKRLVNYDEVLDYFNCRKIPQVHNDTIAKSKVTEIKHINRFKDVL